MTTTRHTLYQALKMSGHTFTGGYSYTYKPLGTPGPDRADVHKTVAETVGHDDFIIVTLDCDPDGVPIVVGVGWGPHTGGDPDDGFDFDEDENGHAYGGHDVDAIAEACRAEAYATCATGPARQRATA
jgi:hypothetical protein